MTITTPPREILKHAVAAAVMAPSSHNTQPWRFRIVGRDLEVLADWRRQLAVIDGDRRQLVQSCGCALFNARVALRAMGFEDELAVLPDPERPELLAILRAGRPIISSEHDLARMRALAVRHTNRRAFLDRPVSAHDAARLAEAAAREGAWAVRLHPDHKRQLGVVIDRADRQQYGDPAFRAELAEWLVGPLSRRRDGIPFVEKEYGSALPFGAVRALRSLELGDEFGKLEDSLVRGSPVVFVVGTAQDDPAAWLAAGQGLQALLLDATAFGLSASFLNQVLEIPDLRGEVAEIVGRVGFPQMVLRLGYSSEPIRHPAPRRPLDDVLLVVE
jgi:nitroreductase